MPLELNGKGVTHKQIGYISKSIFKKPKQSVDAVEVVIRSKDEIAQSFQDIVKKSGVELNKSSKALK